MVVSSGLVLLFLGVLSLVRRFRKRPSEASAAPLPPPPRWIAWVGIAAMLWSIVDIVIAIGGWEFDEMPARANLAFRFLGVVDGVAQLALGWVLRASVVSPSEKIARAQGVLGFLGIAVAVAYLVAAFTLLRA